MQLNIVFVLSLFILASGCNDDAQTEAISKGKEIALLKKENELLKKESQLGIRTDSLAEEELLTEKPKPNPEKLIENKSESESELYDEWSAPAEHGEVDHLYVRKGKHSFSLQWLGSDKPGVVEIDYLGEGEYSIEGEHRSKDGYATINGTFSTASKKELIFNGKIITQVNYNNGGKPCIKKGRYNFLATGKRKYYRLQEMRNCEEANVVDYVDIYF